MNQSPTILSGAEVTQLVHQVRTLNDITARQKEQLQRLYSENQRLLKDREVFLDLIARLKEENVALKDADGHILAELSY